MSIEVVPFEAGLGAEIRGVDIREPLRRGRSRRRSAPPGSSTWCCAFATSR